ncbi:MAG: hypothetical protein ACQESR_17960 [Planctomycetota bacterium]
MERCPTQAVLPLVGLAAENVIRGRYIPLLGTPDMCGGRSRAPPPRPLSPEMACHGGVVYARLDHVLFGVRVELRAVEKRIHAEQVRHFGPDG